MTNTENDFLTIREFELLDDDTELATTETVELMSAADALKIMDQMLEGK